MRYPSLSARIFALLVISLSLQALCAGWVVHLARDRIAEDHHTLLNGKAEALSRAVAERIDQSLAALGGFAVALEQAPPGGLSAYAGTGRPDPVFLWTGIAVPDGTVVAATDGLFVGENVAGRPWFALSASGARAFRRPWVFAENATGPGVPDDPDRLAGVDFAMPVGGGQGGEPTAVVPVLIDWPQLASWIADEAEKWGMSARLVGPQWSPAKSGDIFANDDYRDFRTVSPVRGVNAAEFGLNLAVAGDLGPLRAAQWTLMKNAATTMAAAVVMTLLLHGLFARIVLAPHRRLAEAAEEIAEGQTPAIPRSRLTNEAATLGTALHEILSRLEWHEGGMRREEGDAGPS